MTLAIEKPESITVHRNARSVRLPFKAKRLLKLLVRSFQRVMPSKWFDVVYGIAFPVYKAIVRLLYLLWGVVAYSWRDRMRWQMMKQVHRVMPYTLVGVGGLEATYELARNMNARNIAGDFVELGVARGGCAALLGATIFDPGIGAEKLGGRTLWLFDSYEGLPDPTEKDFAFDGQEVATGMHVRPLPAGSCLGTLQEVRQLLLGRRGFPESRIRFVKGWFQDTIPSVGSEISAIAILRIDGDWYESTKVCLEGLYDKVVTRGAVIIDDYEVCYGCERAVHEFLADRHLVVDLHLDGRGGCYFYKS